MIVRRAFPQIYEYDHPKSGRYWLVSARRPKWNLNERKTFSVKKLAEEYADGIEQRFLDSGRQVEIPKEKVVMVKSYEQLAEKVGNYGVSVEEAIDHFMRYKGDEIVRGAKPFIRDLVEQWKTFKNSKTGLSSKFVTDG
jgi:hypothetical protein